ncbi:hypothetical protein G6F46_013817 [Rhizopus delemar]|nr:hypothetical protein G6F46_013817 [Rhizopus delemar]
MQQVQQALADQNAITGTSFFETATDRVQLRVTDTVTAWSPQQITERLASVDGAIITLNERIGAAQVADAAQLQVIANVGVGYNNLDVDALSAAGILASNTPDVLTETTADLGFALLMATARRITESERWLPRSAFSAWAASARASPAAAHSVSA